MNFWQKYKMDEEATTKGIWREFQGGLSLCIARADLDTNPVYAQLYQEILAKVDADNTEQSAAAMRELYAKAIITGAKVDGKSGYCDQDGKPVKFSVEFTIDVLKQLPELLKEVITISNKRDNYLETAINAGKQLGE